MNSTRIAPLGVVIASLGLAHPAAAEDLVALAARVKPSVVHITTHDALGQERGSGTGFLITADGWIVTNDHVIENASAVRVRMFDQSEQEVVGVLARNFDRDVAIIKVGGHDYPTLALADGGRMPDGSRVMIVGGPLGLTWSQTSGAISAYLDKGLPERLRGKDRRQGGPLIQMDAAISPGSSGSPVINTETGKVIGVAVSIITGARGLNFAVPIDAVQDLMLTIDGTREPESFSAFPLRNLVGSLVFFALIGVGYVVFRRVYRARKTRSH